MEPFLEAQRAFRAPREYQARIIARMPDGVPKAEAYRSIEYLHEAAEVEKRLSSAMGLAPGAAVAQITQRLQSTFGALPRQ